MNSVRTRRISSESGMRVYYGKVAEMPSEWKMDNGIISKRLLRLSFLCAKLLCCYIYYTGMIVNAMVVGSVPIKANI